MDSSRWMVYVVIAAISILSPGPAVLLAISNSVRFGVRSAIYSSLGNVIGVMLVSTLAMLGLGVVLKSSALLFGMIKLVGAGYLIYLGIRQWTAKGALFSNPGVSPIEASLSKWQLFRQGATLALTNPKAILFFTALFPHFLDSRSALLPQFLILTGTFMTISFSTLTMYGLLARSTRRWFAVRRNVQWFNRGTGSVFVLLGIALLRLENPRS